MARDWYRGVKKKGSPIYMDSGGTLRGQRSKYRFSAIRKEIDTDGNEITDLPWFNTRCKVTTEGVVLLDQSGSQLFVMGQGSPLTISGTEGSLDVTSSGIVAKQRLDTGDTEIAVVKARRADMSEDNVVIKSKRANEVQETIDVTASGIIYESTNQDVAPFTITASGVTLSDYTFAMTMSGAEIQVSPELEAAGMYGKRVVTWHEVAQNKFINGDGFLVESGTNFSMHSIIMPYYSDPDYDPTVPIQIVCIYRTGNIIGNEAEYACKFKGDAGQEFQYAITN